MNKKQKKDIEKIIDKRIIDIRKERIKTIGEFTLAFSLVVAFSVFLALGVVAICGVIYDDGYTEGYKDGYFESASDTVKEGIIKTSDITLDNIDKVFSNDVYVKNILEDNYGVVWGFCENMGYSSGYEISGKIKCYSYDKNFEYDEREYFSVNDFSEYLKGNILRGLQE